LDCEVFPALFPGTVLLGTYAILGNAIVVYSHRRPLAGNTMRTVPAAPPRPRRHSTPWIGRRDAVARAGASPTDQAQPEAFARASVTSRDMNSRGDITRYVRRAKGAFSFSTPYPTLRCVALHLFDGQRRASDAAAPLLERFAVLEITLHCAVQAESFGVGAPRVPEARLRWRCALQRQHLLAGAGVATFIGPRTTGASGAQSAPSAR